MKIFIFLICSLLLSARVQAQRFDSLHVYAMSMYIMNSVATNKVLIHDETLIAITNRDTVQKIHSLLTDSIRGTFVEQLEGNNIEVHITFEFFKANRVGEIVGITRHDSMFFDHMLYHGERKNIQLLDKYIPDLSTIAQTNETRR